eukprot:5896120-Karenia_brevis.AAC.1
MAALKLITSSDKPPLHIPSSTGTQTASAHPSRKLKWLRNCRHKLSLTSLHPNNNCCAEADHILRLDHTGRLPWHGLASLSQRHLAVICNGCAEADHVRQRAPTAHPVRRCHHVQAYLSHKQELSP